jgi:hypothetical protein
MKIIPTSVDGLHLFSEDQDNLRSALNQDYLREENEMPSVSDIKWFKEHFPSGIEAAVAGTPFDLDMMAALACQETGEIWPSRRDLSPANTVDSEDGHQFNTRNDGGAPHPQHDRRGACK